MGKLHGKPTRRSYAKKLHEKPHEIATRESYTKRLLITYVTHVTYVTLLMLLTLLTLLMLLTKIETIEMQYPLIDMEIV